MKARYESRATLLPSFANGGPFFHFLCAIGRPAVWRAGSQRRAYPALDPRARREWRPVSDGMLELWQADAGGKYDIRRTAQRADPAFRGFGRLAPMPMGCVFSRRSIRAGCPIAAGGCQAPHINVSVFGPGLLARLCTRIYFEGDPALAEDRVLALVPEERRGALMARRDAANAGQWNFEIHLQGGDRKRSSSTSMSSRLIARLRYDFQARGKPVLHAAMLRAMLRFEAALARAQASLGMIPRSAAEAIARVDSVPADGLGKRHADPRAWLFPS